MKKTMLTMALLAFTTVGFAQLSLNVEAEKGSASTSNSWSIGASAQYLLYYDYYFLPGINVGWIHDLNPETGTNSYHVPIMGMARYYVLGRHSCCGGIYVEGQGGARISYLQQNSEQGATLSKRTLPQASVGLGLRSPMSYDYNIRLGYVFDGTEQRPFLGLKLGYTF